MHGQLLNYWEWLVQQVGSPMGEVAGDLSSALVEWGLQYEALAAG